MYILRFLYKLYNFQDSMQRTKINRSIRLIKEIGILESLLRNKILTCWMSKWFCKWFSIERTNAIKEYVKLLNFIMHRNF